MPSTAIKRLDIAIESSYMSRADGSAIPVEPSDWTPCEFCDASQIVAFGSTQTLETNASTGGFGKNPGEALIDPYTGLPVKSGSMTIDFYLRGGLTDGQAGLLALLWTRFAYDQKAAAAANAAVSDDGTVTFGAAPTKLQFLAYAMDDGRVTYGLADTAAASTSLYPNRTYADSYSGRAIAPATAGTSKLVTWKINPEGADPFSLGARSVALRLTGDDWQQICYGCVMTALTISCDGDGRAIKCSATVDCPYIEDIPVDDQSDPEFPIVTAGPVLHSLGSPSAFYASQGNDNLDGLGGGPCLSAWSIQLNWTTAGAACGSYWNGRGPLEATALEATADITIGSLPYASIEFFKEAWKAKDPLCVLIPFGGDLSGGASPRPWGGAIVLPGAIVANGDFTNPDLSGDAVQMQIQLQLSGTATLTNSLLPLFVLGVF